jgi:hypothetical protein
MYLLTTVSTLIYKEICDQVSILYALHMKNCSRLDAEKKIHRFDLSKMFQ